MKTEIPSFSLNKPIEWIAKKSHVAEHAREIADMSDRWFVSISGGIADLGSWAEREAWIVADSAVTAFATTVTVAKRLSSTTQPRGALSARPPRTFALGARLESDDRDERAPSSRSALELGLDLICGVRPGEERSATSPELVDPCRLGVDRAELGRPSPAGVIPLLQALERTVAKHTHAGNASLQEDPRFWTLINLIQTLGRPTVTCAMEETDGPSGAGSPSKIESTGPEVQAPEVQAPEAKAPEAPPNLVPGREL